MTGFKDSQGFLAVFFILAVIGLFFMSNMSEEISTFYMTFILISLVAMVSKSDLFGDYSRYSIFLVPPIIAHVMNNSVTVSAGLNLPIAYPLILTGAIAGMFYFLFNKSKKALRFCAYGLVLGFVMTAEYIIGTPILGITTLSVPLAIGEMSKVFLLGVMAGVVEEVFFRGVLFQFFRNVMKKENIFVAVLMLIGITFVYMSEVQLVGWALMALAGLEWVSRKPLFRGMSEVGAVAGVSSVFALFHMTAYGGSVEMMFSAFLFSVMACLLMLYSEKGKVI